ncbi:hypothetical protein BC940DRAFT_335022 [Gongronella butleri]|nr:hypothetical protein BC940DRAFT_335022 [Gongronella butleri]
MDLAGGVAIEEATTLFEVPEALCERPEQVAIQQDGQVTLFHINVSQYAALQEAYARHPLPSHLFPWLHGIDGHDYQQCLFFGVRRVLVPEHRGLVLVHAMGDDNDSDKDALRNRMAHSLLPSDLIEQGDDGRWRFKKQETRQGIHLRNFNIQAWRYASISDLVIYGTHARSVAARLGEAQQIIYQQRQEYHDTIARSAGKRAVAKANRLHYRLFVIDDDMASIAQTCPQLVWYDENGVERQCLDLNEREQLEMYALAKACEMTDHVWVGASQDVPVIAEDDGDDDNEDISMGSNPLGLSVCIDCHDLADMPSQSELMLARAMLGELDDDQVAPELLHFDMYSTGAVIDSFDALDAFLEDLKHLLAFMSEMAQQGKRILIHCADGYTEHSLLTLSWLMYARKLTLRQAYLVLQEQRSFFVCSPEVPLLQVIEQYIHQTSMIDAYKQAWAKKMRIAVDVPITSRILLNDETIHDISSHAATNGTTINLAITPPTAQAGTTDSQASLGSQLAHDDWFLCPRFEGAFPSRILPFLYLGNLNHATNPAMLKALGITYVVSVGEDASLDAQQFRLLYLDNLYDDGIDSVKSQYDRTMAFINEAYASGAKCLIHCRVGVSRSAAVTIAYVMQHFHISLVDAYIFVRARRLNVIIQPNLKFMYELLQLEQQLTSRCIMPWPVLCNQIHLLNYTFAQDEPAR